MSGFHEELRRELEALGPTDGQIAGLLDRLERGAAHRRRGLSRQVVVALVLCGALIVTAVAAGPTIREALDGMAGPFSPYVRELEGTFATQGIEVRLEGAYADGYTAQVYFTVTDLTGARLNGHTGISAELITERAALGRVTGCRVRTFDEALHQLVVEIRVEGGDLSRAAELAVTGLDPAGRYADARFQPPEVAETLETVMTEEGDIVLLPGQTPRYSNDCEGVSISSMGFDASGRFHVRLALEEGYTGAALSVMPESKSQPGSAIYQADSVKTEVEDGYDIMFPALSADKLSDLDSLRIYGGYRGPEARIEGEWRVPVALEPVEQREIAVNRQIGPFHVERLVVSPLSVAVFYSGRDEKGSFLYQLAVELDGGSRAGITGNMASVGSGGEESAFSLFPFDEPVDLESISSLKLLGEELWSP